MDSYIRLDGPDPQNLNRVPPQFDTRIVDHAPRELNGIPHPILSRASATRLRDGSIVVFGSVGPRYTGGQSELSPALFLKKPGQEWASLGAPAGDPQRFLEAAAEHNATVRCEGAGIVQLPDGRLRLYAHGMLDADQVPNHIRQNRIAVNTLLIAEADQPEGPWRFLRDEAGIPLNLFAEAPVPFVFAHVQQLDDQTLILTGADAWPPQAVYAAYSQDGLRFRFPAEEDNSPVPIQRAIDVKSDARFCKALRGVLSLEGDTFHAVMNISRPEDRGQSFLYSSSPGFVAEKLNDIFQNP